LVIISEHTLKPAEKTLPKPLSRLRQRVAEAKLFNTSLLTTSKEIHAEAHEVFLKGNFFLWIPINLFGKVQREETMRYAPKIAARIAILGGYGDMELFENFLKTQPELRNLEMKFIYDTRVYELKSVQQQLIKLRKIKVRDEVRLTFHAFEWDEVQKCRGGHLLPWEYTEEQDDFCVFLKRLEREMLAKC
jgi:hypothetical protein